MARDNEKARKSCEHGPENGKLSATKKDGEATTEEVLGSIVTYTEEEILNTFKDDMASENTNKRRVLVPPCAGYNRGT